MTNTPRIFPAHTPSHTVFEAVDNLAEGLPAIIAMEIYDHPEATDTKGVWAVGTRVDVDAYLESNGFEVTDVLYSAGMDVDELADAVPDRLSINGQTVLLWRYPNPDLQEGIVAGWHVERANFADNASNLGVLWLGVNGSFTLFNKHSMLVARGEQLEEVLAAVAPKPKPAPVRVTLIVQIEVDPVEYVRDSAVCATEDVVNDIRVFIDEQAHELPGNPRVSVDVWPGHRV